MQQVPQKDRREVLAEALSALERMQKKLDALERTQKEPLAIIGMGCRFPGHANNPEAFWRLLQQGVDAIEEVPDSRWDMKAYYNPDPESAGTICTRFGGFVDDVEMFDPQFFGISPREAISMDPQHRLALEVTWEALEHAAQAPSSLLEKRVGVFLGITTRDYAERLTYDGFNNLDAYGLTGNLSAFAAGRISYVLGLQGIAVSVDTACSSSLVAMHLACQSLRSGESDMVLAGGVNLLLWPEISVTETKAHMLAPDGRCKAFDARADGFVRGEGCGVLVLKRLSDALADNDNILALVRGFYCNQDGASSGLTVPNLRAQTAMIEGALRNAGLPAGAVDYIEAHGTGTSLGDPIEMGSLASVFGKSHTRENPLLLGSVKTNVGHLESAAGVASVIKVVLALLHEEIPPHLHLSQPNPLIPWDQIPIVVPTQRVPWPRGERPRIAGVSSFGASGTNSHVLLEEAPPRSGSSKVEPQAISERPLHILTLSAKSKSALATMAGRYAAHLEGSPDLALGDVAFSANVGRNQMGFRRAFVAGQLNHLCEQLRAFSGGEKSGIGQDNPVRGSEDPKLGWLFTGQGAQKIHMGRQLYATEPVFREALERCNTILEPLLAKSLLSVLYPGQDDDSPLDQTRFTQPALFALEYALAEVWRSWGVTPNAVIGHSVGEYAAACIAGVFSLEDGLRLINERARLMQHLPAGGGMAVAFAEEAVVRKIVEQFPRSTIAAVNGPRNITISGPLEELQSAIGLLKAHEIESRPLLVSHAFHSPLMDLMLEEFEGFARQFSFKKPSIPLVSNVTGRFFGASEKPDAAYWTRHIREGVRFADGVRAMHEKKCALFLEIGPHGVLTEMAQKCLPSNEGACFVSLKRGQDDLAQMLETLGNLYVRGVKVDWKGFDRAYNRQRVMLPAYPFEKKRYWVEPPPPIQQRGRSRGNANMGRCEHPLLRSRFRSPLVEEVVYEASLDLERHSFLEDLRVFGMPVLSTAGFIEIAVAAARDYHGTGTVTVTGLSLQHALTISEGNSPRIQCVVRPTGKDQSEMQIISLTERSEETGEQSWLTHAVAISRAGDISESDPPKLGDLMKACAAEISAEAHYGALNQMGFDYRDSLRGIQKLWRGDDQAIGLIEMTAAVRRERGGYVIHPGMLDACLQVFYAAWADTSREVIYLPMGIDEVVCFTEPSNRMWSYAVIRSRSQKVLTGDLWVLHEDGTVAALIRGISFAQANQDVFRRSIQGKPHGGIISEKQQTDRILDQLRQAGGADRCTILKNWLQRLVARVLQITPVDNLDPTESLTSLGLDSLTAMELRSALKSALEVDVSLADILSGPSVMQWAETLLEQVPLTTKTPAVVHHEKSRVTDTEDLIDGVMDSERAQELLGKLDELTDEQVERLLLQKKQ